MTLVHVSATELDAAVQTCVDRACRTVPMDATPTLYRRVETILAYGLYGSSDGSMYDPSRVKQFYTLLDQEIASICLEYLRETHPNCPQYRMQRIEELSGNG